MTWPLAANLTTHVPSGDNDLWQTYWNFWWWKEALVDRHQSPYQTDMIFQPEGASLGLHTHSAANMLWTLPINAWLGIPAAMNSALLAGFVLAAFGTYLLAREYVRAPQAAFVAGLVAAFTPNHVEHSLEHLNLSSYLASLAVEGWPGRVWASSSPSTSDSPFTTGSSPPRWRSPS
jgi:hypothetical protein